MPLSDDSECEGGLLLFACSDGRLLHVQRRVGSIMAHDGDAVHGVTQLVKGIRCKGERGFRQRLLKPAVLLFFLCLGVALPLPLPPVTVARYGLYALRRRSSATHLSPDPTLHNAEGVDATLSDGQQVGSALCVACIFSPNVCCALRRWPHI